MNDDTLTQGRKSELKAQETGVDQADQMIPLILDLDDTLLRTDTLYESLLACLKKNPLNIFLVVRWLLMGRAALKNRLGAASDLSVEDLPFNEDVVVLAKKAAANGRRVIIATAADESILGRRQPG